VVAEPSALDAMPRAPETRGIAMSGTHSHGRWLTPETSRWSQAESSGSGRVLRELPAQPREVARLPVGILLQIELLIGLGLPELP
jgi:hypothetical protein